MRCDFPSKRKSPPQFGWRRGDVCDRKTRRFAIAMFGALRSTLHIGLSLSCRIEVLLPLPHDARRLPPNTLHFKACSFRWSDFFRDGPNTTTTIIFQKSFASDATSKRHLMAHQMKHLCVFSVFHCVEGAFGAASGGYPKNETWGPAR